MNYYLLRYSLILDKPTIPSCDFLEINEKKGETYDSFKETQGQILVPVRFIYSTKLTSVCNFTLFVLQCRKKVKKKVFIYMIGGYLYSITYSSTVNISSSFILICTIQNLLGIYYTSSKF